MCGDVGASAGNYPVLRTNRCDRVRLIALAVDGGRSSGLDAEHCVCCRCFCRGRTMSPEDRTVESIRIGLRVTTLSGL